VRGATKIGIGQSMGGCFTIVLQGQHGTFDGIASLGYSGIHTHVPSRPGETPSLMPWMLRNGAPGSMPLNMAALAGATMPDPANPPTENPFAWAFHYDDEPADIVAADMNPVAEGAPLPPWKSATSASCGIFMVAPGTVATEAASITTPVLLAMGERDVIANPWMEPFAFRSSIDITLFVCPRMAHMHNFASTRFRFWDRIHTWGTGVAEQRAFSGTGAPAAG
jgi:pimeloyl-ACP methyl ester carboxylesterase